MVLHASSPAPEDSDWNGSVVPSNQGKIKGCTIVQNEDTAWTLTIDGVEADLGQFSLAIYKKITMDAKTQRFQGFRPGTIPPHLEPTYRAFTIDECARETVLEAMQQNNIRPFENCRSEMELCDVSIPPVPVAKKKKKSGRKARLAAAESDAEQDETEPPQWRSFDTMKEAIDAGWKPGQSFSFRAVDVRGQRIQQESTGRTINPLTGKTY